MEIYVNHLQRNLFKNSYFIKSDPPTLKNVNFYLRQRRPAYTTDIVYGEDRDAPVKYASISGEDKIINDQLQLIHEYFKNIFRKKQASGNITKMIDWVSVIYGRTKDSFVIQSIVDVQTCDPNCNTLNNEQAAVFVEKDLLNITVTEKPRFEQLVRTSSNGQTIDFIVPLQGRIEEAKRFLKSLATQLIESPTIFVHLTFVYFHKDLHTEEYNKLNEELNKYIKPDCAIKGYTNCDQIYRVLRKSFAHELCIFF